MKMEGLGRIIELCREIIAEFEQSVRNDKMDEFLLGRATVAREILNSFQINRIS